MYQHRHCSSFQKLLFITYPANQELEASTSRNYNLYASQIEGLLPSKTIRKLDAGKVEVRRLGLSEYMGRLYSLPEVRELEIFRSFIQESHVSERHQLTKRLTSLEMTSPLEDAQESPASPSSPSPLKKFNSLNFDQESTVSDFRKSVDAFSRSGVKCSTAQRLTLYGLYKQSMFGDVDYQRPKDDARGQRKYDAWNVFNGLTQEQVSKIYIYIYHRPECR